MNANSFGTRRAYRVRAMGVQPGDAVTVWETYTPDGNLHVVPLRAPLTKIPALQRSGGTPRLSVHPTTKTVALDPSNDSTKTRRPTAPGKPSGSYTIPHGDNSYDGAPRTLRKVLRALLAEGWVGEDYTFVRAPQLHGKTVAEVLASTDDPVSEIATKSRGKILLYHGTSVARYAKIKTEGLKPGKTPEVYADLVKNYSEFNVYLTSSVGEAENYATRAALQDKSLAVVLEVEVNDFTRFVVDEDWAGWRSLDGEDNNIDNPTSVHFKHEGWREGPNAQRYWNRFMARMLPALKQFKTVGYRGALAANKIRPLLTYKPVRMKRDPKTEEFQAARDKTLTGLRMYPTRLARRVAARWFRKHVILPHGVAF
jgi:hypothetical protein